MSESRWYLAGRIVRGGIIVLRDAVGVAGAICIVNGVRMWSAPCGWIMAGVLLLAASLLLSRRTD